MISSSQPPFLLRYYSSVLDHLQTRDMPLKQFQEKYPDDFKTGALQEIRQRYAAMAAAAQQAIPATAAKGGKTGKKRPAAEPMTVLQTVKTRRTASALMPSWGGATAATAAAPPLTSTRRTNRGTSLAAEPYSQTQQEDKQQTAPSEFQQQQQQQQPFSAAVGGMETSNKSINSFNGRPLETPLPFAGASMPLPVTMLTQKRGGRTKAAAAPDAAVVTTADGMQWALGRDGISAIPETHRAEVADMLSAQFNFLAAALGKTVFDRPGGKGGKSSRR